MNKRERQQQIREKKQAAEERKKKLMRYGLFGLIGIIGILLAITLVQRMALDVPGLTEITGKDHIKGYEKAPLTLVEYSDFQCPACRAQDRAIQAAWKDIRRNVKIIYRHYPLTRVHKNATEAAYYAEAAGQQDKFWEMHDQLFAAQPVWGAAENPTPLFEGYAEGLGLDMDKVRAAVASDEVIAKVKADVASGRAAGVQSTPTLYLDGELLSNVRDRQSLIDAIEDAKDLK